MASTASPSLRLELMGTGDQSGTWGVTTNTNLGTLLEQAITGYLSIAKSGTSDLTLTNQDYVAGPNNQNRNVVIEITGTPGGAFNVIVPNANKLWVFKNSTPSAMTIKTSTGTTTVTVAASTSRWVFCDGSNAIYDALTGTLATQAASNVAITGGTITGLTSLTLASGVASPATNDAAALGTGALSWSDLFLASGGVINFANGDVTITHSTDALAFAGAANGYSFASTIIAGSGDGTATVTSGTLRAPARTGTDAAGTDITIASGNGTGTGGSGIIAFQTAATGSTGSTANTLTERMRIAADGGVLFGSATTGGSKGVNTLNAVGYYKNGNDITTGTVTYIIDGGGATITTGSKGYLTIPFGCTITQWTVLSDQTGSVVIDVKRSTYSGFPTTTSLVGAGNKPTITTSTKGQAAPSGWAVNGTVITAGDVLEFNVDSITSCQRVTLSLSVTRS